MSIAIKIHGRAIIEHIPYNPPFLQSTTDFKTEKYDDVEKDVNGDGGGGLRYVRA